MRRSISTLPILVILFLSVSAHGAILTGSLLYDGAPLATTFDDVVTVVARAVSRTGGPEVQGTVDLVASTYNFSGLEASEYIILFTLIRSGSGDFPEDPGNLYLNEIVILSDPGGTLQLDLDVLYRYRVLSPVDSFDVLDGMALDCNEHPAVTYPITYAIEPPPGAADFTFRVSLRACPGGIIDTVDMASGEPSTEIEWGTANEDFQSLSVKCTGSSGRPLCATPNTRYQDIRYRSLLLRNQDSSARGTHHSNAVVIPAVASAPGAHGTYWSSAVSLTNLEATERNIVITYTPRDADGLATFNTTTVFIHALAQISWSDIMTDLFSTTGAGAVEILGNDLAVTSRTSTPGADGGSYGQGIPPLQPTQILSTAGTASATMGGVEEGATFRTNLGLCEIWGESATVRVTILDAFMAQLGSRTYELRPYENMQINRVVDEIAGTNTLANGSATVTVTSGNGRIGAYLSVVDNATGDPTFIAIAPQSPTGD